MGSKILVIGGINQDIVIQSESLSFVNKAAALSDTKLRASISFPVFDEVNKMREL